jgi:hypothetical protein
MAGVKGDASKLHGEGNLASLKMNFLVLIMQLIMLGKDVGSRTAFTQSDCPNKLANCDDGIRRQMMLLHAELAQNINKHWMWWHMTPCSKKVLEIDGFVRPRLRHRLCTGGSTISLGKIVSIIFH